MTTSHQRRDLAEKKSEEGVRIWRQGRFQLNKKKRLAGHIVAGYACQVNFSPDGRFVISGDGEGKCWFWDWKSCKDFRTLKCHEGVCIGCEWHPLEQSKVATCGWDGMIKYWSRARLIFSRDGHFVISGDGEGKCWFWDWKSCKDFRTLKCHEGVCIGCEWHPLEQSKVATCGWDGMIKYW